MPGQFANAVKEFGEAKVNILAYQIDPRGPFSIVRMICDPTEIAKEELQK